MSNEPKSTLELTFVSRDPDETGLLRLMVLNPCNNEMSTFVNQVIETDSPDYEPRAADLHTFAYPRA
jgi:hypothetical protein